MKNMVLLLAMMSMVVCTTLAQPGVDTQTRVFDSNFKSLQVKLSGNDYFPPIIMMGSDDVIEVRFDELSAELSYLRYSVVHCNANWQPSQLIDTEYLDGFNYANIENYEYSSGTFTHFVHYEFTLPNDEIRFTKSGNYLVQVYREDFPDEILLQARFMVCENVVGVYPSVSSRTDIDFNVGHQQVDITIDTRDYMVRDMYQDLAVCVSQNSRVDNEVWVGRPMRVMGSKVIYEHDRKLIFPATVAVNYPTMGVSQVEYYHPFYHATLHTDEPRTDIMYLYDKTQNGRFTIRNAEADDSDGRADYLVTHFSLATGERLTGGKVYIEGEFTNHLFNSSSLMRYDEASGCYVADILLKQGAYNYQYLFVPDGTNVGVTSTIEGDKYQTVNEYSVKVYNRQPGERYDRLVGFGMVFSGK